MNKEAELVKIKCPSCGNTIVTAYKGKDVKGELQHKCAKCGRLWDVDYTNESVKWCGGKEKYTPIKEYKLKLSTGSCYPLYTGNMDKALLRREGA